MHEISSEFYNGNSNGLFSSRGRSAAEKLSQSRYSGGAGRDYLYDDHSNDECTRRGYCDCVACSYLEFKQITGLGGQAMTATAAAPATPATVGISGVTPPYSQCKSIIFRKNDLKFKDNTKEI